MAQPARTPTEVGFECHGETWSLTMTTPHRRLLARLLLRTRKYGKKPHNFHAIETTSRTGTYDRNAAQFDIFDDPWWAGSVTLPASLPKSLRDTRHATVRVPLLRMDYPFEFH